MRNDLISRRGLINDLNKAAMEHHESHVPMVEHDFRELIDKAEGKEDEMERAKITALLSETLRRKMSACYASEVTLDYGSDNVKRVDFVEFKAQNAYSVSGVEKGNFTFYEVKSCVEDIYSGNGLNFYGDYNFLVMTMETYKAFMDDFADRPISRSVVNPHSRKFWPWYRERHPDGMLNIGIMVAVPDGREEYDEFEEPTEFNNETTWRLKMMQPSWPKPRGRSAIELLYCMLRSGK